MFPFSSHTRSHFVKTYGLGVPLDCSCEHFPGMAQNVECSRLNPLEPTVECSVQACRLAENYSTLVSKRLLYSAKCEGAAEWGSSSAAFGFRFPASRANVRGQAILDFS